ncbi:WD40 repeat domain-containing protein [Candidatus Chloroploca sp. M-50]|uniref:WD40 repeat domain-containing protein n=1 Tax=Candidatus Chloroploca mongolica TaxID=2528176 RepID=A0ABS4D695_9CHLR|nr:WD40 repeat domain-containing protein [Candidatus Chloroploca mongolica]MBP1464954.1 WD40 repeat domain-containing protein [Candidatus Chloroploca mongolica]
MLTPLARLETARHGSIEARLRCFYELVGPTQGWLAACRDIIAMRQPDLLDLTSPSPLAWAASLIAEQTPLAASAVITRPAASADLALALLVAERDPDEAEALILRAATQWANNASTGIAHSAPKQAPEGKVPSRNLIGSKFALPEGLDPVVLATFVDLAHWLTGQPLEPVATCSLPVLLEHAGGGLVADLTFDLIPDLPVVCFPAPATMAFCAFDATFAQALQTAEMLVHERGLWSNQGAVRWYVDVRAPRLQRDVLLQHLRGSSLGLGFTLGLLHLLRADGSSLQRHWAVTGALGSVEGDVVSVAGYATKLAAAANARLHVLYPVVDQAQVARLLQAAQIQTHGVEDVDRALAFLQGEERPPCPYRGLDHFSEADAPFFFGRQYETATLIERLRQRPRLLALLGGSGSGKSSLIYAGLVAQLALADPNWQVVSVRLADRPFLALAEAGLLAHGEDLLASLSQQMQLRSPEAQRVIVFDQFEEFLVLCRPELRARFLEKLQAVLEGDVPVTLLIVMRNDFYSQLSRLAPSLMPSVADNQIHLPNTLTREALIDMITAPALAVGVALEAGLAERIVGDVFHEHPAEAHGSGATLPLLQFMLTRLWEQSDGMQLAHSAYQAIGGISGSLISWGTTTVEQLTEQQRMLVARLLLEFVQPGNASEGRPDSRRRRTITALAEALDEDPDLMPTLQHLVAARLLVSGREHGRETVELIHDALVQEWPYLRDLLEQNRRFLAWKHAGERQLAHWQAGGERPGRLIPRDELATARRWRDERQRDLGTPLLRYLTASETYWHRRQWHTRLIVGGVMAVLLIGLFATLLAYQHVSANLRRSNAERSALAARQMVAQRPEAAIGQALEAFALDANPTTEETLHLLAQTTAMRAILTGHQQSVLALAVSPDGQTLATASSDRTIILWDLPQGEARQQLRGHTDQINTLVFSPDGQTLASGGGPSDRTVRLWDTTNGALRASLQGHSRGVVALAFRPDGLILASMSGEDDIAVPGDGTVRLWEVATGEEIAIVKLDDGFLQTIAFHPDGQKIIIVSRSSLVQWHLGSGKHELRPHRQHSLSSATVSANGRFVVLGGDDGTMLVTSLGDETNDLVLRSDGLPVTAIMLSRDNAALVSGHTDGQIRLWDLNARRVVRSYRGHTAEIRAITLSPDGALMISGGRDRQVRLWARKPGGELHAPLQLHGPIHALAFNHAGTTLAIATHDRQVVLYDLAHGEREFTITNSHATVQALAFSHDDQLLALGDRNGVISIWDRREQTIIRQFADHQGAIQALSFSPQRPLLASIATDDTLRLWDQRADWAGRTIYAHRHDPVALLFQPHTSRIVTASRDQTVRRWDATTAQQDGRDLEVSAIITALAYDQRGWLYVGLASGEVQSFDPQMVEQHRVATGETPFALFTCSDQALLVIASETVAAYDDDAWDQPAILFRAEQPLTSAALSTDRRLLALGNREGEVYLLFTDPQQVGQVLEERLRERTASMK